MRSKATWVLIACTAFLALVVWMLSVRLAHDRPLEGAPVADDIPAESTEPAPPSIESPVTSTAAKPGSKPHARTGREKTAKTDEASGDEDSEPRFPPSEISGRLINSAGEPIRGANVYVLHAPSVGAPWRSGLEWRSHLALDLAAPLDLGADVPRTATSDGQGAFHFPDFPPGRLRFLVTDAEHAPIERNDLLLAGGQALDLGRIVMSKGVVLSGRVVEDDGRDLGEAACIRVDDFADASLPPLAARTGALLARVFPDTREFRTRALAPGPWSFVVCAPGHPPLRVDGNSQRGERRLLLKLEKGSRIRGRVIAAPQDIERLIVGALPLASKSAPIPFACRADVRTAVVQPRGFVLDGLSASEIYELRAGPRTLAHEDWGLWSPPASAWAEKKGVEVPFIPDCSLSIQVIDAERRSPFAHFEVLLEQATPHELSLDTGKPSLDHLGGIATLVHVRPSGDVAATRVEVRSPGCRSAVDTVELSPGKEIVPQALLVSSLPRMTLTVLDARTDKPIRNALAHARDETQTWQPQEFDPVLTDAKGVARVPTVFGPGAIIGVRAKGYAPVILTGPFGTSALEPKMDVRLSRGACVTVRVVDPAGAPLGGLRVERVAGDWSPDRPDQDFAEFFRSLGKNESSPGFTLEPPEDRDKAQITSTEGVVVFTHLAPGRHVFRVQRWRDFTDSEWSPRDLFEGEDLFIQLATSSFAALQGKVHEGLEPLVGARLALVRLDPDRHLDPVGWLDSRRALPPGVEARTDMTGAFAFVHLDPGAYVMCVAIEGQSLRCLQAVRLKEGYNTLDVDLSRDVVEGRVLDAAGKPARGAEVYFARESQTSRLAGLGYVGERGLRLDDLEDVQSASLEHPATVADEEGWFRLRGLVQRVKFRWYARAGESQLGSAGPFEIDEQGPPRDVVIHLVECGSLAIQISGAEHSREGAFFAVCRDKLAQPRVIAWMPGLPFVLALLEPGEWRVLFSSTAREGRWRALEEGDIVNVVAGRAQSLEIRLP